MTAWQSRPAVNPGPKCNDEGRLIERGSRVALRHDGVDQHGRSQFAQACPIRIDKDGNNAGAKSQNCGTRIRDPASRDALDLYLTVVNRLAKRNGASNHQRMGQLGHGDGKTAAVESGRNAGREIAGALDQD